MYGFKFILVCVFIGVSCYGMSILVYSIHRKMKQMDLISILSTSGTDNKLYLFNLIKLVETFNKDGLETFRQTFIREFGSIDVSIEALDAMKEFNFELQESVDKLKNILLKN